MSTEGDELIDIEAAAALAGVKAATIKSWNRKDKILTPVDNQGMRGKNRYHRSDVLAAMRLRGIRPPATAQADMLPAPREEPATPASPSPQADPAPRSKVERECSECARKDQAIQKLETQVASFKEIALLAMNAV